jgi:hypothetical protein
LRDSSLRGFALRLDLSLSFLLHGFRFTDNASVVEWVNVCGVGRDWSNPFRNDYIHRSRHHPSQGGSGKDMGLV